MICIVIRDYPQRPEKYIWTKGCTHLLVTACWNVDTVNKTVCDIKSVPVQLDTSEVLKILVWGSISGIWISWMIWSIICTLHFRTYVCLTHLTRHCFVVSFSEKQFIHGQFYIIYDAAPRLKWNICNGTLCDDIFSKLRWLFVIDNHYARLYALVYQCG